MNDNEMELVFDDNAGLQFITATTPSDADLDGFGGDLMEEMIAAEKQCQHDRDNGELCFE